MSNLYYVVDTSQDPPVIYGSFETLFRARTWAIENLTNWEVLNQEQIGFEARYIEIP